MGKHEPGTPKYIANKMKAKGLQKLRWYCQMCQKQCRDENGFKCHITSESHQRNLLMFADNSKKYMDEFSTEFMDGFMDLLRRQFGTKRVAANKVYQDYIANREHIHMNSTRWVTLTGFVKWLGRTGKAVVDETEKGWFIQYIDRDPETLAKQKRKSKKQKMDKDDEEKLMEFVEKQVQHGQVQPAEDDVNSPSELLRKDADEKISLQLKLAPTKQSKTHVCTKSVDLDEPSTSADSVFIKPRAPKQKDNKRKVSGLEEIMFEEMAAKKKKEECWISKGIVVKIITPLLGEKYYNKKAVIDNVDVDYQAVVRTLPSGHKLKIDQVYLQTVIPQCGKPVLIVQGKHKHKTAILKKVLIDSFSAVLEIKPSESNQEGKIVELPYNSFCKINME